VYGLLGGVSSGGETSLQTSLQTNLQRAEILYHQAITVAETRHYPQVQANALKGLGELQRGQGKFALALQYQERAIALLEDIGAQCDLAEAQFQLALTHGLMGNGAIMAQLCDRAIQCFEQIQAPKQVQRIQATLATLKVHPNPLPTTTKGCPPA
jgi:tetratricopeptide (TPR) repeat protein